MATCTHCGRDKSGGKTDAGEHFYCTDCIDEEDMVPCEDCGELFPSTDILKSSTYGKVCGACARYLDTRC